MLFLHYFTDANEKTKEIYKRFYKPSYKELRISVGITLIFYFLFHSFSMMPFTFAIIMYQEMLKDENN